MLDLQFRRNRAYIYKEKKTKRETRLSAFISGCGPRWNHSRRLHIDYRIVVGSLPFFAVLKRSASIFAAFYEGYAVGQEDCLRNCWRDFGSVVNLMIFLGSLFTGILLRTFTKSDIIAKGGSIKSWKN